MAARDSKKLRVQPATNVTEPTDSSCVGLPEMQYTLRCLLGSSGLGYGRANPIGPWAQKTSFAKLLPTLGTRIEDRVVRHLEVMSMKLGWRSRKCPLREERKLKRNST